MIATYTDAEAAALYDVLNPSGPDDGSIQAVDFSTGGGDPIPQRLPTPVIHSPDEQCVERTFRETVGPNLVKDGFKSGLLYGAIGAAGGAMVTAEIGGVGGIPGGVLGFVGGFVRGVFTSVPKTYVKSTIDCTVDGLWPF